MTDGAYSALFRGYDKLNSETDYAAWADFITEIFKKYGNGVKSVLDLGCGTGAMTFELRRRGFDMTAVDINPDMLSVARDTAVGEGADDILWLCQDMRSFELYGTVGAVVCCLDGINHLLSVSDLNLCFSLVHNYLDPDGIFVFDVNTPYKFRNFYGENDYVLEEDGILCCWQNDYDEKKGVCDFYLSVFEQTEDGKWERTDAVQRERCYSERVLKNALERNGMKLCGIFADFGFSKPQDNCERWYIAAKVCDK